MEERYVYWQDKYYVFGPPKQLTFGSNYAVVFPGHGDFNCDCQQCRIYRAIRKVEKDHNVHLSSISKQCPVCPHSLEFHTSFETGFGIIKINLPQISV